MNRQPDHIAIDMRSMMQQQQQQQQQQQYAESYTQLSISSPLPDLYRPTQQQQTAIQQIWTLFGRYLR
jgi:hypothetical protein